MNQFPLFVYAHRLNQLESWAGELPEITAAHLADCVVRFVPNPQTTACARFLPCVVPSPGEFVLGMVVAARMTQLDILDHKMGPAMRRETMAAHFPFPDMKPYGAYVYTANPSLWSPERPLVQPDAEASAAQLEMVLSAADMYAKAKREERPVVVDVAIRSLTGPPPFA